MHSGVVKTVAILLIKIKQVNQVAKLVQKVNTELVAKQCQLALIAQKEGTMIRPAKVLMFLLGVIHIILILVMPVLKVIIKTK